MPATGSNRRSGASSWALPVSGRTSTRAVAYLVMGSALRSMTTAGADPVPADRLPDSRDF